LLIPPVILVVCARASSWLSVAKPDGWVEALNAAMVTPRLEPEMVQKLERMVYENSMVIPLYSNMAMWAVDPELRDSGIGTRGASQWWEPQNTWLSK